MTLTSLAVVLLLASQGAPERYCQPAEWPKRMPPVDTVVDSAALASAFTSLSLGDTADLLFSILYLEDGSSTVRLMQPAQLPPAFEESFTETVSRTVRPRGRADRVAAVRLRVLGSVGGFILERSSYCPPSVAPGWGVSGGSISVTIRQGDRMPANGRQRVRMDMQLSIDDGGHVTDVRVINGTGVRELDEELVNDSYRRTYLPAMIDGLAIKSWVRTNGTRMRL